MEKYLLKEVENIQKLLDQSNYIEAYAKLSTIDQDKLYILGEYSLLISFYNQLLEKGNFSNEIKAEIEAKLGRVYYREGNLVKGKELLLSSSKVRHNTLRLFALSVLGGVLKDLGEESEAKNILDEVIATAKKEDNMQIYAGSLVRKANLIAKDNSSDAISLIDEAITIAKEHNWKRDEMIWRGYLIDVLISKEEIKKENIMNEIIDLKKYFEEHGDVRYIRQQEERIKKINESNWNIELFGRCNLLKFSNLNVYYTLEIKEDDLIPDYLNHYIEGYLLSNFRLSSLKSDLNNISDIETKQVDVFITTNKELFKEVMEKQRMVGVNDRRLEQKFGFVANGVAFFYIDYEILTKYLPPRSGELDSLSHEFTHILLPQYLNIEWEEYKRYWNNVFDEGFAVLLNKQYMAIFNMKKDFNDNRELNLSDVSIDYLKRNGFFKIDNRGVIKNFEYQYAAAVVERIDNVIRRDNEYTSNIPLRGFFKYLTRSGKKERDIESDLKKDFNIEISTLEKEIREEIGME